MVKPYPETVDFEILLSTMNRNSLDFLKPMFPFACFKDYNILIINQTTGENVLESNTDNIRVINSFEKGLSNSRNLALDNALGKICLLADDDVIYKEDFEINITQAYNKYPAADIITFKMVDAEGKDYRDYPNITVHDKKTLSTANSVVISFKNKCLVKNVRFNPYFGLGCQFPIGNEYVFLRNALSYKLRLVFEQRIILSHPNISSGKKMGDDNIIFGKGALFYKYSGFFAYPRLVKHLYGVYRLKGIKLKDFMNKFFVGIKGIKKYKQLINQNVH